MSSDEQRAVPAADTDEPHDDTTEREPAGAPAPGGESVPEDGGVADGVAEDGVAEDGAAGEDAADAGVAEGDAADVTEDGVVDGGVAEDEPAAARQGAGGAVPRRKGRPGPGRPGLGGRGLGSGPHRGLLVTGAALAVAALVVAVWFGASWLISANGDDAEFASSRDAVVREGTDALKAFTELDYRNPDQFFERALGVSTGDIHDQLAKDRERQTKLLVDGKSVVTTKVLEVAVNQLDDRAGKASFLAVIHASITQGEQSAVKPMRFEVQLTRDGDSWKVSGLDPVPVVGSGQQAQGPDQGGQPGQEGQPGQPNLPGQ